MTHANSAAWDVQFEQTKLALRSNHAYTVTFWAKADRTRAIHAILQQTYSPYTDYMAGATMTLTTQCQQFRFTMPAQTVADNNTALRFGLAQTLGTVWLDGVTLVETS